MKISQEGHDERKRKEQEVRVKSEKDALERKQSELLDLLRTKYQET
jgi:hypothetical protein